MYVLVCPCCIHPHLRADGITSEIDLKNYIKSLNRCKEFGLEVISLPCPETEYLGNKRKPGTYLERLNTPEFHAILETLTMNVREIIKSCGLPLCILGVNSSPTCGVTSTYYGIEKKEVEVQKNDNSLNIGKFVKNTGKKEGRGVFLNRFPDIPAFDVAHFAAYKIYLAAPLFTLAEKKFNSFIANILKKSFFKVYIPQESGDTSELFTKEGHKKIFSQHVKALHECDLVIAIVDGSDADSGTSWEMGYAFALGKRIISLRTDFRRFGLYEPVNLMLSESSELVKSESELLSLLNPPINSVDDIDFVKYPADQYCL